MRTNNYKLIKFISYLLIYSFFLCIGLLIVFFFEIYYLAFIPFFIIPFAIHHLRKILFAKFDNKKLAIKNKLKQIKNGNSNTLKLNEYILDKIPSEIFTLQNLEHLDLSCDIEIYIKQKKNERNLNN